MNTELPTWVAVCMALAVGALAIIISDTNRTEVESTPALLFTTEATQNWRPSVIVLPGGEISAGRATIELCGEAGVAVVTLPEEYAYDYASSYNPISRMDRFEISCPPIRRDDR